MYQAKSAETECMGMGGGGVGGSKIQSYSEYPETHFGFAILKSVAFSKIGKFCVCRGTGVHMNKHHSEKISDSKSRKWYFRAKHTESSLRTRILLNVFYS